MVNEEEELSGRTIYYTGRKEDNCRLTYAMFNSETKKWSITVTVLDGTKTNVFNFIQYMRHGFPTRKHRVVGKGFMRKVYQIAIPLRG